MTLWWRVTVVTVILSLLISYEVKSDTTPILRLCDPRLRDVMELLCNFSRVPDASLQNEDYSTNELKGESQESPQNLARQPEVMRVRREIPYECCYRRCTIEMLQSYCGY